MINIHVCSTAEPFQQSQSGHYRGEAFTECRCKRIVQAFTEELAFPKGGLCRGVPLQQLDIYANILHIYTHECTYICMSMNKIKGVELGCKVILACRATIQKKMVAELKLQWPVILATLRCFITLCWEYMEEGTIYSRNVRCWICAMVSTLDKCTDDGWLSRGHQFEPIWGW